MVSSLPDGPLGAQDERRVHQRKVRYGMARVRRAGGEEPPFFVPLINISLGGLLLRSPVRPRGGEKLEVEICFTAGPTLDAAVEVTRDDDAGFGCRFVEMGDAALSTLQHWMGPYGALVPPSAFEG